MFRICGWRNLRPGVRYEPVRKTAKTLVFREMAETETSAFVVIGNHDYTGEAKEARGIRNLCDLASSILQYKVDVLEELPLVRGASVHGLLYNSPSLKKREQVARAVIEDNRELLRPQWVHEEADA